jgi:serine protease AprX
MRKLRTTTSRKVPAAIRTFTAMIIAASAFAAPSVAGVDTLADKCDHVTALAARAGRAGWASLIVRVNGEDYLAYERRVGRLGGYVYRHLPLVHCLAARVPTRNVRALANEPFVQHISADVAVVKNDEFTVASSGADTAYQTLSLTGQGVGVAVIDSGVQPCDDLFDPATGLTRVVKGPSFVASTTGNADPCGHGTHIAGIVAGNGYNSTGSNYFRTFNGIARRATIVGVRVLDDHGAGTVSNVIAGVQWAVTNRAAYNIRVINLSLGHPAGESYTTDPLCQAVEAAWSNGIVVVCAAGNNGRLNASTTEGAANEGYGTTYGSVQSPANDPYVITVGATKSVDGNRANDRIATYSSRGPSRLDLVLKPDIVAPGNRVISLATPNSYLYNGFGNTNTLPWMYYKYTNNDGVSNRYFRLSGTSMAAPVVSGAVALILEATPNLSPDTVKARLMVSADKWAHPDGTRDVCTFGAGYLNIPAALNCTVTATLPAISPTMYRDASGVVHLDVAGIRWGSATIWGMETPPDAPPDTPPDTHLIWGTDVSAEDGSVPSSHLIWGTSVWEDHLIWGTSSAQVDLSSKAIIGEP